MLFCQNHADEPDDRGAVGEDADHVVGAVAADLAVQAFVGLLDQIWRHRPRRGGEREHLLAGCVEVFVRLGQGGEAPQVLCRFYAGCSFQMRSHTGRHTDQT